MRRPRTENNVVPRLQVHIARDPQKRTRFPKEISGMSALGANEPKRASCCPGRRVRSVGALDGIKGDGFLLAVGIGRVGSVHVIAVLLRNGGSRRVAAMRCQSSL